MADKKMRTKAIIMIQIKFRKKIDWGWSWANFRKRIGTMMTIEIIVIINLILISP